MKRLYPVTAHSTIHNQCFELHDEMDISIDIAQSIHFKYLFSLQILSHLQNTACRMEWVNIIISTKGAKLF